MKLFKTDSQLETHTCRKEKSKDKTHKCVICGEMYAGRRNLNLHIRRVHDKVTKPKNLSCPYCKYRTDTKSRLTEHMATHTGDKLFKCTHCDYTAALKYNVTVHIHNQHTNKTYKCLYGKCSVRKSSVEELHEHIRTP